MNCQSGPCVINLSVEIELPNDLSDELLDEMVEDLTAELNIDQLHKKIKRWARFYTGVNCRVDIDVE